MLGALEYPAVALLSVAGSIGILLIVGAIVDGVSIYVREEYALRAFADYGKEDVDFKEERGGFFWGLTIGAVILLLYCRTLWLATYRFHSSAKPMEAKDDSK